jgi:phenylacetate-CoA ligase
MEDMDKDFKDISQKIKKLMGEETKIKYNIVDEIKTSPSEKYIHTFSNIEKV